MIDLIKEGFTQFYAQMPISMTSSLASPLEVKNRNMVPPSLEEKNPFSVDRTSEDKEMEDVPIKKKRGGETLAETNLKSTRARSRSRSRERKDND